MQNSFSHRSQTIKLSMSLKQYTCFSNANAWSIRRGKPSMRNLWAPELAIVCSIRSRTTLSGTNFPCEMHSDISFPSYKFRIRVMSCWHSENKSIWPQIFAQLPLLDSLRKRYESSRGAQRVWHTEFPCPIPVPRAQTRPQLSRRHVHALVAALLPSLEQSLLAESPDGWWEHW